jgi:hypothetical protein
LSTGAKELPTAGGGGENRANLFQGSCIQGALPFMVETFHQMLFFQLT